MFKDIPIYLTRKKIKNQQDFIDETCSEKNLQICKFNKLCVETLI